MRNTHSAIFNLINIYRLDIFGYFGYFGFWNKAQQQHHISYIIMRKKEESIF